MIATAVLLAAGGCAREPESQVVLYAAVEQELAGPIVSMFHRSNDGAIQPELKFGAAPDRAAALADQLIAQAEAPVADVFWDHEILQTVRLQKAGLLRPHRWNLEPGYPAELQARDGSWCGFAARARVLLVNTERLGSPADYPRSVQELGDPRWEGRCALANPLSGTAAAHAAVIRELDGEERSRQWFRAVAANAVVLPNSQQVAAAVSAGRVDWGLTDSDVALAQREAGHPVAIVFPDQQPEQPGTLRVPHTVAILKDAPHGVAAARLVDFLVTPQIEDRLAMGSTAQLPVSRQATHHPRVLPEEPVRWVRVDFEAAAEHWDELAEELRESFR